MAKKKTKKQTLLSFAKELSLPIDMATETLAFLGRKGQGKTYGAQRWFELLHTAGVQCVALDPVGNWWSLRVGKNGKGRGLPVYVFGGPRGDVPILPDAGAFVARVIVEKGISVILDVSRFRKAERKRFMTAFAEEFFHLKKDAVSPVHVFVEEAHKFVPQMVRDGEEQMLGAMEDIIRIGRNYGIGASLISQRSASVNKDVLSQVECLVAYQTGGKQDKKAIKDWVEENDEQGIALMAEMKSLQQGEALFWSPAALKVFKKIHITEKITLDASSTPKIGSRTRTPVKLAPVDLKSISEAMQQVVVDAEANNVGLLKKKLLEKDKTIKNLEQRIIEMGKASGIKTVKTEKLKELVPMISHRQLQAVDKLVNKLLASQDAMAQRQQVVVSELGNFRTTIQNTVKFVEKTNSAAAEAHAATLPKPALPLAAKVIKKEKPASTDTALDGPCLRVLGALAWFEGIGIAEPSLDAVAFLSDYSGGTNGAFNNARGRLRSLGMVTYPSPGATTLTEAGRAAAPAVDVPSTGAGLREAVMKKLDGPCQRVLQPLLDAYPNEVDGDSLAKAAGYSDASNGAFNNARGRLRTLGLVTYPRAKFTKASEILFPKG